jgi:hypothetical protein
MAGYFSVATFREVGAAATPQNLFTIENTDPAVLVKIRRLIVQADETVALATVTPVYRISRATGVPTGGSILNKALFDTNNSSNANVVCRGSTASDGGALSGPTATAGDALWEQFVMRVHTAVGQILMPDSEMLPYIVDTQDLILRQNQALLVQIVAPAGASNPATNHYIVACAWQEV